MATPGGLGLNAEDILDVAEARADVAAAVELPPGWSISWCGQFENLQAASSRRVLLVPLALLLIVVLLHAASGRAAWPR